MNELLYNKIDDCIRKEMDKMLDKMNEHKANPALSMLVIVLCASISSNIKDILSEDTHDA